MQADDASIVGRVAKTCRAQFRLRQGDG